MSGEIEAEFRPETNLKEVVIEGLFGKAHALGRDVEVEFDDLAVFVDAGCVLAPLEDDFHHLADYSLFGTAAAKFFEAE